LKPVSEAALPNEPVARRERPVSAAKVVSARAITHTLGA
jgi:hypothetical protein